MSEKNVPTGENIACGYNFCLFSEHHISKFNYILVPECHIVTAAAFKVNVRYIVSVQKLMKLPVILKQKVLCAASHIYLRYFLIFL